MSRPPFCIITIDTEGDNLWALPREITTRNARHLPRFQELCERFGLPVTWLVNYEMARDEAFQALGRDVLARGTGEIGMHMHAWHSPPHHDLTGDDYKNCPYLIEYPEEVMRQKIAHMTSLLEETFQTAVVSHRSGRWAFDERYARLLLEHGYRVDCSVTPHVSWKSKPGAPNGAGGTDFSRFPDHAYFMDPESIGRKLPPDSTYAAASLVEVPMTISPPLDWQKRLQENLRTPLLRSLGYRLLQHKPRWLRPRPGNLKAMLSLLKRARKRGDDYVEFMLHSSELMPGGSPTFPDADSVSRLYEDLETLFGRVARHCRGITLAGYDAYFRNKAGMQ